MNSAAQSVAEKRKTEGVPEIAEEVAATAAVVVVVVTAAVVETIVTAAVPWQ